jgi:GTPase
MNLYIITLVCTIAIIATFAIAIIIVVVMKNDRHDQNDIFKIKATVVDSGRHYVRVELHQKIPFDIHKCSEKHRSTCVDSKQRYIIPVNKNRSFKTNAEIWIAFDTQKQSAYVL